jgi:hypothetical protein
MHSAWADGGAWSQDALDDLDPDVRGGLSVGIGPGTATGGEASLRKAMGEMGLAGTGLQNGLQLEHFIRKADFPRFFGLQDAVLGHESVGFSHRRAKFSPKPVKASKN